MGTAAKVHIAADTRCRPDRVLADKAYSSMAIRTALHARGIKATIPSKANEITGRTRRGRQGGRPPTFDKAAHKTRNVVERTINKLRQTRAVATYPFLGDRIVMAVRTPGSGGSGETGGWIPLSRGR